MRNRAGQDEQTASGTAQSGWGIRTRAAAGLALTMLWGGIGCHHSTVHAQDSAFSYPSDIPQDQNQPGNGNLAPVDGQYPTQNEAQQQAAQYQQGGYQPQGVYQGAPVERRYASADSSGYAQGGAYPQNDDPNASYDDQAAMDDAQAVYEADVTGEEASQPPPPLPDYDQPPPPEEDYIWTPGYWAWSPMGYYWVPGVWVEPPYVGALWTPGYWAFYNSAYRFHHGFWGLHIGFYGGINYGYGYTGYGYYGGYWRSGHFFYNRECNRIDTRRIVRVYDYHVTEVRFAGRPSFNGPRGIMVRPRPAEIAVLHERRYAPLPAQVQLHQQMMQNRQQFYQQNHGRPVVAVESRPVLSNHQMPAALPQTAWRGGSNPRGQGYGRGGPYQQNRGTWQGNQPIQPQIQPIPQGRVMPQQGGQGYTPRTQAQPAPQQGGSVSAPRVAPQPAPQQPTRQDSRPGWQGRSSRWQQQNGVPIQPQAQPQPQTRWQQQNNAPVPQVQPQPPQPGINGGGWQRQQTQPTVSVPSQPQPQGPARWQERNSAPIPPQAQPQGGFRREGWQGQQQQPAPVAQPPAPARWQERNSVPAQPQAQPQPPARWQERNNVPAQVQPAPQYRRGPEGARMSPPPEQRPQQPAPQQPQWRPGRDWNHDPGRGRDR